MVGVIPSEFSEAFSGVAEAFADRAAANADGPGLT